MCNENIHNFTCLPNGLSSCPCKFRKLLQPAFSALRKEGITVSAYLDVILLIMGKKIHLSNILLDVRNHLIHGVL